MSLSNPKNPVSVNPSIAKLVSSGLVFPSLVNNTQVNQIRGIGNNNTNGAGIPRQVSNVQVSIANAQKGATCTVSVLFRRDSSDRSFSGVNVWVRGYQGNAQLVQVASGTESPTKFTLNNTGETVSFTIQAFGNSGNAPLSSAPTSSGRLPKSTTGGFGSSTVVSYSVSNPPPAGGLTLATAGQGFFWGGSSFGPPSAQNPVITSVANQVRVAQLILPFTITVRKITVSIATNTAGASFASCAIYSSDGNTKLLDAGANAFDTSIGGAVRQTVTITPVTLQPGVYLFASSCTDNHPSLNYATEFNSITSINLVVNKSLVRVGTAANAMSGGAMPTTLGVLTDVSFDISGFFFEV